MMKDTITVIQLLNDIANHRRVPKHIEWKDNTYTFYLTEYCNDDDNIINDSFFYTLSNYSLNSEITIIGDEYVSSVE